MSTIQIARRAFSLVEILVVVIVIAIIAAAVVPNTIRAGDTARVAATAEDLRNIAKAVETYRNAEGRWPAEVGRAVLPVELRGKFLNGDPFEKGAPIGGVYDYDGPTTTRGPRIAIRAGAGSPMPEESLCLDLDEFMDDGDPARGSLRREGEAIFFHIMPD